MEDGSHVDPALKTLIERCCVCFVVDHDVWLESHVAQGVDAFEVLLGCCVIVGEHKYLCKMAFVELTIEVLFEALQAF